MSAVLTSEATCEETGPERSMPQRQASGLRRAPEGATGGGKDAGWMGAVGAGGTCEA